MRATTVINVAPAAQEPTGTIAPPAVRRLLVVCSHPFDATFALGGVIAAFASTGTAVQIVCLTHDLGPDPARRRRRASATTMLRAADALGAREAILLDHDAERLQRDPAETLGCELRSVAGPVDAVLTVDARFHGAHPDLVRAMRAAQRVAARLRCPLYGWVRATAVAGFRPGDLIAVNSDRTRQGTAIACQGVPAADDPVRLLCDMGEPNDYLALLQVPELVHDIQDEQ